MAKTKTPAKAKTEVDRADPRFHQIDLLVRRGVMLDGRTKDDLVQSATKIAKEVGLKNLRKDEINRMCDFYRKEYARAELRGPFHAQVAQQSIREQDVQVKILELASQYTGRPSDLRDHTTLFDSIAQGSGQSWRAKCREMVDRLEQSLGGDYTTALAELRDQVEEVFDDVAEPNSENSENDEG